MTKQIRAALAGALLMAMLGGGTYAVAAGEGRPILGGARSPSPDPSQSLTRETEIIADTNTFGTRQSNKSNNGGGAVYGCRSLAGGTERGNEPCIRSTNLVDGRAFEFNSNTGAEVGRITGPATAAPFTTSALGVATGLNADRVDSLNAEQLVALARAKAGLDADTVDGQSAAGLETRWARIAPDGTIEAQTGGFSIVNCYQANENCYIAIGEDARDNGISAEIGISNNGAFGGTTDVNGTATSNGVLSGETGSAACGADFVTCAPNGTEANEVVVVAPRTSAGGTDASPVDGDQDFRFTVFVTDSASG